jgi:hypothetical protein
MQNNVKYFDVASWLNDGRSWREQFASLPGAAGALNWPDFKAKP